MNKGKQKLTETQENILGFFIGAIGLYAVFCFCIWDWNPYRWDWVLRTILSVVLILWMVFCLGVANQDTKPKGGEDE